MKTRTWSNRPQRARRELTGGWVAAVVAVLATAGLVWGSDPAAGSEGLIWVLAPTTLLAAAAAAWLGLRARRDGEPGGRWPASVGLVIGGYFVVMMLVALVAHLLGFE